MNDLFEKTSEKILLKYHSKEHHHGEFLSNSLYIKNLLIIHKTNKKNKCLMSIFKSDKDTA